MRFMILVKADESTEAGVLPSEDILAAMGRYNEELMQAGVLLWCWVRSTEGSSCYWGTQVKP